MPIGKYKKSDLLPEKSGYAKKRGGGEEKARKDREERDRRSRMAGNLFAEKWTEETVSPILEQMIVILTNDESTGKELKEGENPVRANDIKLWKEVCLCAGITGHTYSEWRAKFTKKHKKDEKTGEMVKNPNFSDKVSALMNKILEITECRLQYSGTRMDEFILKNHYNYVDQIDHTSGGEKLENKTVVSPIVQIIEKN